jgi:protein involved in polysaccharide export with SLBB domain
MPSNTTLFNALYFTGGPSKSGSLRNIQIKRPGGVTRVFDFYRFLISGDSSQDLPLQSGDLIFIPPAKTRVTVQGEVLRPAIYELQSGEALKDAIRFAGGAKPSAVTQRISIQSVRPGMARRLVDVNLLASAANGNQELFDGDVVTVFGIRPQLENLVTLEGAVDQPSRYQLTENMTVADLIEKARGTLSNAYMQRADLFRTRSDGTRQLIVVNLENALKRDPTDNIPLMPNDRVVIYGINDVQWMGNRRVTITGAVRKPGAYERAEGMKVSDLLIQAGGLKPDAEGNLGFLQRTNPDGSMGPLLKVNLLGAATGDPQQDVPLQDRDELRVFTVEEASYHPEGKVSIKGAVQRPGSYDRGSNMTLVDLVQMAGGLLPDAYASQVYVQRNADDGTVGPLILSDLKKALDGDPAQNVSLKDGDSIIINSNDQAQFMQDQTVQILGAVQRPGTYARASNMTLLDLLRLAGGTLPNASDSVEIAKAVAPKNEKSVIYSLQRTLQGVDGDNPRIQDQDVVTVHTRGDMRTEVETVTLSGAVRQPGTYAIADGERLSSLIQRAGGLTTEAFPDGAQFFRNSKFLTTAAQRNVLPGVAEILSVVSEQEYKRALGRSELDRLKITGQNPNNSNSSGGNNIATTAGLLPALTNGGPSSATAAAVGANSVVSSANTAPQQAALDTVSAARPLLEEDWIPGGNLNVSIADALKRPNSRDDVVLRDGDVLNIPNKPTSVSVVGAVLQPSSVLFQAGQPILYYVTRSGGFLQDAALDQVIVIRSNGQLIMPKGSRLKTKVELGDVIFVPTKVMAERLKDRGADIDRIANRVSSTAIMLAVLKALL